MMGPMVTDLFGKLIRNFSNEHASQPIGGLLLLAWLAVEWRRRAQLIQEPVEADALPVDHTNVGRVRRAA
jgi:hypothetical protein